MQLKTKHGVRSAFITFSGFAVAGLLTSCSADTGELSSSGESFATPAGEVGELSEAVVQANSVAFAVPAAVDVHQLAIGASAALTAADRVVITGVSAASTKTTGSVNIANDAKVQTIVSGGTVTLGDRTKVTGDITAGGAVSRRPSTLVTGTVTPNANLPAAQTLTWSYASDTVSLGNVVVNSGQSKNLTPGTYGSLTVNSQGNVTLHSGVYVFSSVSLTAASKIVVDSAGGPVQVYDRGAFSYQGSVVSAGTSAPELLVVALGTGAATVLAPFTGVLLAPNASLTVQSGPTLQQATFFAKSLSLGPDVKVSPAVFNWGAVVPSLSGG